MTCIRAIRGHLASASQTLPAFKAFAPCSSSSFIGARSRWSGSICIQRQAQPVAASGTRGFGSLGPALQVSGATSVTAAPQPSPLKMSSPQELCPRLAALREAMAGADGGRGVQAYLVPTEDPHMSEYSPECFKRREWISKFTGTAGTVVVTGDKALLWTDGRYFLQASQELTKEWTLMKAGTPGVPDLEDWLALNLPPGARVGVDPFVHTVDSARRLEKKLKASGKEMVPLLSGGNLVDKAWGSEQPAAPTATIRVHEAKWAGETIPQKVERMSQQVKAASAEVLLVSMLDEVAWLYNLRGSDVSCNPVFLSYAMVGVDKSAALYVDSGKLTKEVEAHLKEGGVTIKPYGDFITDVRAASASGKVLYLDPSKVSYAVYQAAMEGGASSIDPSTRKRPRSSEADANGSQEEGAAAGNGAAGNKAGVKIAEFASPVVSAKAVKNAAELEGMKEAHLRDAVALCTFISELEAFVGGGGTLTEVEVDERLTGQRKAQTGFVEPSFPTIAGAGPNGAIIHYRAQPGTCRSVDSSTLLLVDSGGQYDCGTTDITRTFHFGTPTAHQMRCYTRVLQGHIGLDLAVFPEGTPGAALDTLARVPLWKDGLNYRHGTGHGVGAALNVHEGPQSISMRYHITTPLAAHMICSNEPGYYEDGGFGIRIENLATVKEVPTPNRFGGVPYFGFEALTLVPIQTKMMDTTLMSAEEVAWVDSYHQRVWDSVSARLSEAPEVLEWLKLNTRPIAEQNAKTA